MPINTILEKIRVFEAFAGYGSQSMALEKLKNDIGLDYEVVGISEIDPNAIKAYYAARDERLDTEDPEELKSIVGGGVSANRGTDSEISQLRRYFKSGLAKRA